MNYFISQFGKPEGGIGKIFAKIMNMSNRRMYKANLGAVDRRTSAVMEIGYGNGRQLELIKKAYPGCALYGIDVSEEMYNEARKRLGNKAELYIGEAEGLPFEDNIYDIVTCYFWQDPDRVFSEIQRTLKDKGLFVNSYNTMYAASVKRSDAKALSDDQSIITLAEEHGFKVVYVSPLGRFERQIVFKKH